MAGKFPGNYIIFILIICDSVMCKSVELSQFSLGWEWFCLQDHIPEYLDGKCIKSNNNKSILL